MRAEKACCGAATGADAEVKVVEAEGAELEDPDRGHSRAKCSIDPHVLHFMMLPLLSLGFDFLPKPKADDDGAPGGLLLLPPR